MMIMFLFFLFFIILFCLIIIGKILLSSLFEQDLFLSEHRAIANKYLQLLQKFEVALCIGDKEVIIPSLFPESQSYPKPNDSLKDVTFTAGVDANYLPPIRRVWFSNYIPDGFWPRLICRLLNDQLIKSILNNYYDSFENSVENSDESVVQSDWTCWKSGLVYVSRGRTLLLVRHIPNPSTSWSLESSLRAMNSKWRIEIHIYVPEMITVLQEIRSRVECFDQLEESDKLQAPYKVAGQATQLMVAISNHISFLSSWFQGMLEQNEKGYVDYVPCWKCYGGLEGIGSPLKDTSLIDVEGSPCVCLPFASCIIPSSHDTDLQCPVHGVLKVVQTIPDLVS